MNDLFIDTFCSVKLNDLQPRPEGLPQKIEFKALGTRLDDLLNIFATFPFFIFRKVDVLWTALSPNFAQMQCNLVSFVFISTIIKSGKFVSVTFHQAMMDQKWCSWLVFLSCYWCLVCEEPLPSLIVGFIRDRVENQAGCKRRSESLSNCKKTERQSQTAIR